MQLLHVSHMQIILFWYSIVLFGSVLARYGRVRDSTTVQPYLPRA